MGTFDRLVEQAKLHPMAVHAYSVGGGKFKVHAVGAKVKHVSTGETISSSDLDDLSSAGHKVKETKKPGSVKEESNKMNAEHDAHYDRQPKDIQTKINNQLRQGKTYPEAAKACGVPLKEEETVVSEKLTDDAKKNIQTALGPKVPGNKMRATSDSAKAIIAIAKSNKKNLK